MSNNIVNILSKAIEKAVPKIEAHKPFARPETAKVTPSQLFNQDKSVLNSQKNNNRSETKAKPKIDLEGFYRNFGMLQTNPTVYNDPEDSVQQKDSLEESIANDLSQYLRILNSQRNTKPDPTDLQTSEKSEGEIDFSKFQNHHLLGPSLAQLGGGDTREDQNPIEKGQI